MTLALPAEQWIGDVLAKLQEAKRRSDQGSGMRIGYAAMLEQRDPMTIIENCVAAEANGFSGVMATDHFQPWLPRHRAASHVWTMLGAIGAHTHGPLGPGVTTPGARAHPAIVAQAAATLAALYPERVWLGVDPARP